MTLTREIEVRAPRDIVWKVVSDIDNEAEYWHGTREVRNTAREGNVTDRVVVQNFMGTKVRQRVVLTPKESVETKYLEGPTVGTKMVTIHDGGGAVQTGRARWDVRFTGVLWLITPVIRNHIVKGTENALARIKEVSETKAAAGS